MSTGKDYTIETVLSSSQEYGSGSVAGKVVISQAPFGLRPYMARFRKGCVPYMAGTKTALDYNLRNCDPTPAPIVPTNQTINLPQIASTANVYTPTLTPGAVTISLPQITSTANVYTPSISAASLDVDYYTQIVSASNPNNSSSMHVGSLYLEARTYTTFGALFTDIKGGVGGSNAHVELKRFTNGVTLLELHNTGTAGPTWRYVTTSSVTVSTSDSYDIYISASGNPATASIRGVYYEI